MNEFQEALIGLEFIFDFPRRSAPIRDAPCPISQYLIANEEEK
jgi:hypothetical protein